MNYDVDRRHYNNTLTEQHEAGCKAIKILKKLIQSILISLTHAFSLHLCFQGCA